MVNHDIADMVERYGLRVAAGPSKREHAYPVNQNREEPEIATAVLKHCRALAGMIRAGITTAEADWPAIKQEG